MDDCGFFARYFGRSLRPHAAVRDTTELRFVQHRESYFWIENSFGFWLGGQLGLPVATLGSIHASMKEIFNNIENHSGRTIGCTHMQHFPRRNEIVIAVADYGIGIPTAIRSRYPQFINDCDAILHASQNGVTSGNVRNQGIGLNFLIEAVVKRSRGPVSIHSGRGRLACKMVGQTEIRTPIPISAFHPGTAIEIRLNTDTFTPDEDKREDWTWDF